MSLAPRAPRTRDRRTAVGPCARGSAGTRAVATRARRARACARSVAEMLPVCEAVGSLTRLGAKRLGQFLGPCIDVCTDCEQECRKHANKHAVCKACADACARFIAEAKTLQAT